MRLLILLRHAKSSWTDQTLDDHERPLAPRGREAAPRVGRWLEEQGLAPDLVLCSTAVRTRETLDLIRPHLSSATPVRHLPELYEAAAGTLLDALRTAPAQAAKLLLIGHNPGLKDFARRLALAEDTKAYRRMMTKFPTAALAVLACEVADWQELVDGGGRLQAFVRPRDLSG